MALNLSAVGQELGPLTKTYTWKDVVLYALGVGAGFSNLEYCYENRLKVLPSFSIASIFEILAEIAVKSNVNLAGILHGEQELVFHHPIPPEGTMTTKGQITHIYDKGRDKGALVVGESVTCDGDGRKLFTSICTVFARLDGGFDGPDAPKQDVQIPSREPDFMVENTPSSDQPLLYRLSGDIFSLHVDPDFAKHSGFEKPLMHGLCTHGFACRALVDSLVPGEPEKARRMVCRFTKPLYPGVPIQTQIWQKADGHALWRTINAESGDVVIDQGIFEYGPIPTDIIRFDNQVAVVTGAGAGLGRAYALELARRGAKLVINDFGGARDGMGEGSVSPADAVVKAIQDKGGTAVANYDSVATAEGGANIIRAALDAFGRVDILINNAGILRDKSFIKMAPENWQAVLDVHLNGAYNVTRPAFKVMKTNGYGRIVMTTSAAGLYGNFGQTNYSAAKMGLVGLMNTLKIEGCKYDIRVNTVAPIAASRLTQDVMPPELFAKAKPEYVVPMVLFLCSERCPVSGQIFNAGMGFFNRAAVITGSGTVLAKEGQIPTVEDVQTAMGAISALETGKEYEELSQQILDMVSAFDASAPEVAKTSSGYSTAEMVFAAMPQAFQAEAAAGVDVVFQFNISGEDGGDWFCIIKNESCRVESGTHGQPECTLKMRTTDFLDMMNGVLPAMQAFTSGKLIIEGDIIKSQLIEKLFSF